MNVATAPELFQAESYLDCPSLAMLHASTIH